MFNGDAIQVVNRGNRKLTTKGWEGGAFYRVASRAHFIT